MTYNAEISYTQDTIQHFGMKGYALGHRNRKEYLTNRYISKGYNPKAAREKAKKRVNTEGKLKKAALIGGGVALAGLAAYGGYKGVKHLQAKQKAQFVNAFNAANASQSHTGRKIKDVTNSISKSEIGNRSRKLLN